MASPSSPKAEVANKAETADKAEPATPYQDESRLTPNSMRKNSDPALRPDHHHHHSHVHHSPRASTDERRVSYTKGSNVDPTKVPEQSHLHHHDEPKTAELPTYTTDPEKQEQQDTVTTEPHGRQPGRLGRMYRRHRWVAHLFVFALFTGWWIASLVLHRDDKNWVVPFLFWLCITLRLVFFHVPSSLVSRPIKFAWQHTAVSVYDRLPPKLRVPLGALVAVGAILLGAFVSEETEDNTRENRAVSLFGLVVLIAVFWATSKHRSRVSWRTVTGGMLAQFLIALFVLRTTVGYDIFKFIADRAGDLLGFSREGTEFLTSEEVTQLPWFLTNVIPAIIFFISLVSVLFYIGFLQWFIKKFAKFVFWALRVSGSESVVAVATPFIGQGESAMLVSPFVEHMTKAEIHQIMTCGFATISGSVLVAYIGLGLNRQALVSSCIMSIPASIALSKLRWPETEETLTSGKVVIPDDDEHKAENFLHAFANGSWFGIKIAGTIIASLICILAAVGLIDGLLSWWGSYLNINDPPLTLELIASYILYPVVFLLGVPRKDIWQVAQIVATKVIKNEFLAFLALTSEEVASQLSPRSILIATFGICGFGNIGSLGIQIGILSQIAPSRGGDVARIAPSAFICGVISTLTSACMAGLLVTNQESIIKTQG